MRLTTVILALLLAGSLALRGEPELKGNAADLAKFINGVTKTVTVAGESEVRVPAARAVLTLSVITESKLLQEALRANADARSKVMAQLKQQGIAADHVQSSRFSSTPKFGLFGDKAKSYRVENVMRVSVPDEKEFRSAAGVVDTFAEVQYGGVEFEYADKEALKQKAIAQACDNTGDRKKIYEDRLGLKLTPVRFSEGTVTELEPKPPTAPRKSESGRWSSGDYSSPVQEAVSSFGELVFSARVAVEYSVAR
jgi:uncharacterized protein YggE